MISEKSDLRDFVETLKYVTDHCSSSSDLRAFTARIIANYVTSSLLQDRFSSLCSKITLEKSPQSARTQAEALYLKEVKNVGWLLFSVIRKLLTT